MQELTGTYGNAIRLSSGVFLLGGVVSFVSSLVFLKPQECYQTAVETVIINNKYKHESRVNDKGSPGVPQNDHITNQESAI